MHTHTSIESRRGQTQRHRQQARINEPIDAQRGRSLTCVARALASLLSGARMRTAIRVHRVPRMEDIAREFISTRSIQVRLPKGQICACVTSGLGLGL
jgi:hypothetical protein